MNAIVWLQPQLQSELFMSDLNTCKWSPFSWHNPRLPMATAPSRSIFSIPPPPPLVSSLRPPTVLSRQRYGAEGCSTRRHGCTLEGGRISHNSQSRSRAARTRAGEIEAGQMGLYSHARCRFREGTLCEDGEGNTPIRHINLHLYELVHIKLTCCCHAFVTIF